jgi:hypothetical protein
LFLDSDIPVIPGKHHQRAGNQPFKRKYKEDYIIIQRRKPCEKDTGSGGQSQKRGQYRYSGG